MECGNKELDTGSLIEMSAVFVRKRVIVASHYMIFNLICVLNMFNLSIIQLSKRMSRKYEMVWIQLLHTMRCYIDLHLTNMKQSE